ncbi:MAG: 2-dehydro-3-deoxy-6-phosphogalactonate aldolase [Burkholderiales bacterium]|nr:2-dehydro-3-deoxy-6-phosphogalactonate aldolase [Burkholderiales bacterium]
MNPLSRYLDPLPLVAVLRGITPEEIPVIGDVLVDVGFQILEVPLNSPRPYESIGRLARRYGERCLVGAGTVLAASDVPAVREAGGRIVVMPHADGEVIRASKALGLVCVPGVATPTEAFAALAAGADALKMFPAEGLPPGVLRAWRAVLPRSTLVLAVGGMKPDNLEPYWVAGASGFGTGASLYKPGASSGVVREVAAAYAAAIRALPAH